MKTVVVIQRENKATIFLFLFAKIFFQKWANWILEIIKSEVKIITIEVAKKLLSVNTKLKTIIAQAGLGSQEKFPDFKFRLNLSFFINLHNL